MIEVLVFVQSPNVSKQMQMLPIVFQTSDTACHVDGTCCKQSAIIKADTYWLGKLGFTSIFSAFSIANYNRTLLCCRFISLDIRVSGALHSKELPLKVVKLCTLLQSEPPLLTIFSVKPPLSWLKVTLYIPPLSSCADTDHIVQWHYRIKKRRT